MANLSRPSLSASAASRQRLAREPVRRPPRLARRAGLVLAVLAGLAALAWLDGGEEPLHPIAQGVELPENGR